MADLSRLTIPVKDPTTGAVTPQTFNLKGSGSSANAYSTTDTVSNVIHDADAVPMLDDNGTTQTKKNVLWTTIVSAIKAVLATVASTGDYNDLSNKPNFQFLIANNRLYYKT